jgi:dUTP pyrophosphatase
MTEDITIQCRPQRDHKFDPPKRQHYTDAGLDLQLDLSPSAPWILRLITGFAAVTHEPNAKLYALAPGEHSAAELGLPPRISPTALRLHLGQGAFVVVRTGWALLFPEGWCGVIHSRSGLGSKFGLVTGFDGVVDARYTGEIQVPLEAKRPWVVEVKHGDRIAQIVPTRTAKHVTMEPVKEFAAASGRGANGFGSTGR